MVAPSYPSSPSPKSSYLVLAVKILLVVVIILLLPKLVFAQDHHHHRSQQQRRHQHLPKHNRALQFRHYWQGERRRCEEETECAKLVPEESLNCIHKCLSSTCYEQIYAANPLEDGEIDLQRATDFETCLHGDFKLVRERQLEERRRQRERRTAAAAAASS